MGEVSITKKIVYESLLDEAIRQGLVPEKHLRIFHVYNEYYEVMTSLHHRAVIVMREARLTNNFRSRQYYLLHWLGEASLQLIELEAKDARMLQHQNINEDIIQVLLGKMTFSKYLDRLAGWHAMELINRS